MLSRKRLSGAVLGCTLITALLWLLTAPGSAQQGTDPCESNLSAQDTVAEINSIICGHGRECKLSYDSGTLTLTLTAHFGDTIRYDKKFVKIEDLNFSEIGFVKQESTALVSIPCNISKRWCITFTAVLPPSPDQEQTKTFTTQDYTLALGVPDAKSVERVMADLSSLHRGAPITEKRPPLPDIPGILAKSLEQKVAFSREEMQKLGLTSERLKDANRNSPSSAMNAKILGDTAEKIFGKEDPRVELAFQRGCALPYDETKFINFCEQLGRFYERRQNHLMAIGVYTLAPKCRTEAGTARSGPPCLTALADFYLGYDDRVSARDAYGKICLEYSIPRSCSAFAQLGGKVDLEAAQAKHQENIQEEREQRETEKQERAEQAREKNERFNTMMDPLRSMPGGSDPNAIINVANQQGAQMVAIGAANDAARQEAAARRLAVQQSARPQTSEVQSGLQQASESQSSQANPPQGGTPSSETQSTATAGRYAAALPSSCIGQFWNPKYYNWLSFQNNCGQAIHLNWIAASPSDTFGMSATDLALGAANNSGWSQTEVQRKGGFLLFVCPAGYLAVDVTTDQVVSRANQQFRCKQQ